MEISRKKMSALLNHSHSGHTNSDSKCSIILDSDLSSNYLRSAISDRRREETYTLIDSLLSIPRGESVHLEFSSLDYMKYRHNLCESVIRMASKDSMGALGVISSLRLYNDTYFMSRVPHNIALCIQHSDFHIKNDRHIIRRLVIENPIYLQYASDEIRGDRLFMMDILQIQGLCIMYASDFLKDDHGVGLVAVTNCPFSVVYLSEALKNRPDIQSIGSCLGYGVSRDKITKNNKLSRFIRKKMSGLPIRAESGIGNPKILLETIQYSSEEARNDFEIMMKVVSMDGTALQFASRNLKSDTRLVSRAMDNNPMSIQFASYEILDNKEFMMEKLEIFDGIICFVSDRLKDDKDIIRTALSKDKHALCHASDRLRDDDEFAISMVSENGKYLQYFSDRLKKNLDMIILAVRTYPKAISLR